MLIHEIPEGSYGIVDNMMFVRPPGAAAFRLPGWLEPIYEQDGTLTVNGPIDFTDWSGVNKIAFLLHDVWHVHELKTAS